MGVRSWALWPLMLSLATMYKHSDIGVHGRDLHERQKRWQQWERQIEAEYDDPDVTARQYAIRNVCAASVREMFSGRLLNETDQASVYRRYPGINITTTPLSATVGLTVAECVQAHSPDDPLGLVLLLNRHDANTPEARKCTYDTVAPVTIRDAVRAIKIPKRTTSLHTKVGCSAGCSTGGPPH